MSVKLFLRPGTLFVISPSQCQYAFLDVVPAAVAPLTLYLVIAPLTLYPVIAMKAHAVFYPRKDVIVLIQTKGRLKTDHAIIHRRRHRAQL